MDISYSRHAKRQMKWREITEDEVKDTVLYPESVTEFGGHHTYLLFNITSPEL